MRWYLPGTWAENIGRAKRLTPYISLRRLRIWGHSITISESVELEN